MNTDSGILGDVSDPYVTMKLSSQSDKARKRTETINNNLNPEWNSKPFLLPVTNSSEQLILEVWDDDLLKAHDFMGRLVLPLHKMFDNPGIPMRIKDRLSGDKSKGE